jgi:hypothetical protein
MLGPVKCHVSCVTVVKSDPVFDDMISSFDIKKDDEDEDGDKDEDVHGSKTRSYDKARSDF